MHNRIFRMLVILVLITGGLVLTPQGQIEARPLLESVPAIGLNVPAEQFLGENVSFTVTFDNPEASGGDAGYGPFIQVFLDTTGADGVYPGDTGVNAYDGLGTSSINVTYAGSALAGGDVWELEVNASGQFVHPILRDGTGNFVIITAPAGFVQGDKVIVARLPFGSFVPDQPPATLTFTVNMSNLADLGTPLNVAAQGGYQFGYTPLDDWCCGLDDPSVTLSGIVSDSVTPTLVTMTKTNSAVENEIPTGPNYPHTYEITVEVANGQTISNLDITDTLPNNVQYIGPVTGATCSTLPSTDTPGGILGCTISSFTGTATITFPFYIPLNDLDGNPVIDADSGDDGLSCNNVSILGDWTPIDTRDAGGSDNVAAGGAGTPCENSVDVKSNAIQKGVGIFNDEGVSGYSPNDTLIYTLNFQVSDYFAFDDIVITDTLSDGQHWDTSYTPTLAINGNQYSISSIFDLANYTVDETQIGNDTDPDTDGSTTVTFRVSDQILASNSIDTGPTDFGWMVGGCIPMTADGTARDTELNPGINIDCDLYDNNATTATITYRAIIQQNFTDTYPSGDASVDQGDTMSNTVTIDGQLLSVVNLSSLGMGTEADGSTELITIARGNIAKTIYSINGAAPIGSPVRITVGDKVTYRVRYVMNTSDVEDLEFTDYFPLPIFDVTDPDADGVDGPAWGFDSTKATGPGNTFIPGVVKLGPDDSFYEYANIHTTLLPTVSAISGNAVNVFYGDFDGPDNSSTIIDLLFTVTVTDEPFADGLYLTNQASVNEGSTNTDDQSTDALVQIQFTAPAVYGEKSVVATNGEGILTPAITAPSGNWTVPGSPGPRWSGNINSTWLAANSLNSNLENADAGDLVTFAIILENRGSGIKGAFDMVIKDILDSIAFEYPIAGDANSTNLQIYYGNGSGPITYTDVSNVATTPAALFGTGIKLVDPIGAGVCSAHDPNLGNNVIVITYDLRLKTGVEAGETYSNDAALTNYAGQEGGEDFANPDVEFDAEVSIDQPEIAKSLVSTEINSTGNSNIQAVIGEYATYQLVLTVPEGTTSNAEVVDRMSTGLAFADVTSVTYSSGVTSTLTPGVGASPANVAISNYNGGTGNQATYSLGTITNTNTDDATLETITIEYRSVVLNVTGNQGGSTLSNTASFTWLNSSASDTGDSITVVEPTVTVDKAAQRLLPTSGGTSVDAGDTVQYTITLTNTSGVDAFDTIVYDTFPTYLNYATLAITSVTDSASTLTAADFNLNTATGVLTTTNDFTLPGNNSRTVRLVITGVVISTITPNTSFNNDAYTQWTSMPEAPTLLSDYTTSDGERTGADGEPGTGILNDYQRHDGATLSVPQLAGTKYLVASSESATTNPRLTIGEIARFRLSMQLPEGVTTDLSMLDRLPAGMRFLNDGTAKVAFVSTNGSITSSTLSGGGLNFTGVAGDYPTLSSASITFVLPDPAVSTDRINNVDNNYDSGRDVYFKFGTITNTSDNDADNEFVVVEFNALVENIVGNQAYNNSTGAALTATTLSNDFRGYTNTATTLNLAFTSTPAVSVTVAEPSITDLTKAVNPPSGDSGDTVTYTVTFSNASGANASPAYDVVFTDFVPVKMNSVSNITVNSPAGCALQTNSGSEISGNSITVNFSVVPVSCAVTITYQATLTSAVIPGEILTNNADVIYTSLPGTEGTNGNPTGSNLDDTINIPGSGIGERTNGTGVNDYQDATDVGVEVTPVQPVKLLISSTDINSSDPNLTIGETARFRLEVSLAEGSSPAFTITDNLPTGLQYIGNAKIAFVSTGDLMTSSNIDIGNSPWITGDETTLTTITPTFDLPVSALNGAPFGDGTDPVFNFSDITNGETDASQEFVVVEFDTVVLNTSANQNTVTLTNNFTVSIDSIDRGTSNNVVITIVEPWLTAAKTIALHTGSTVYQAGSQIDYTLTFTNNGTAWAYDVSVVDDLPPYVTYDAGTISCAINSISAPAANITPVLIDAVDPQPDFYRLNINSPSTGAWDIPNSQALVCSFTATIQNSVFLNGTYTNTTDADWTSQDATPSEERVYDSGSNSYDTGTDYNVDLNQDTATVVFNVTNPAITKTVDKAEATIGDTVRYTISVTSPLGTINNLVITDTLPTGIIFDSVVSNSGFASYPGDPSGSPLTWVFGDVVITSSPATIVFDAVIADIDTNVDGTVRTNTVRLDYQNAAGTTQTPLSATALTTIRESRISTTKVVTPDTGLQSGTVLNYTMTYTSDGSITAYDVALRDDLPPHTTYNGDMVCTLTVPPAAPVLQSITVTNIPATTSYDIVPTIPGDWDLAVNSVIRCTFSATVEGSMPLIGTLTNVTDADWTSQDGIPTTPAFERVYDGGTYVNDSGTDYPNDGDQDTASAPATSNAPTGLTKTVDKPNAVVGETVRYTISLTSPLGTIHNLVLTDTLPAGMIYAGNVAYSGFGGTLIDPATPDPNDGSTSSPLTWALGDREITVSPATISFDAIVANVITNQEGTVRTNTVEMNYQNAAGVDQTPLSDDVDVTVHEPVLTIVKSITASGPFDAGDSVPYQLLITNTSGYTAYDVLVRDITAYDVSGVSYTSTGTLVNVSNISAATNEVYYSVGEFPAGATMTITYNVVLPIEVSVGERVQNDVRLTWTSQPGVNPNERIGVVADTLNDYIANDSEYFDIQLPTFSKSVDKATATIGETVTYTLTIDSPSASINAMSITDVLPAGMVLTGEPIYSWIPIPDEFNPYFGVSSPNDGTAQIDLFWDFGTVEVTASPITITYTAVVANELINQNARTITNNAELRFWDRSENEHVLNDDVAFAVIEPVLTISKQADDLTPGLGQTIDFIITVAHDASSTATAYDVVVTDTIPTGLTYVAGSINQTCGTSDESTAPQLSWTIPSLAPAATCTLTYQATLDLDAILGSSLSNTAVVTWTSLTGSPEEERRGVVDSLLDNYIDQSTVDLLASGFDLSINKDDGVEQTQTGSTLTYTINYGISGTQPATDVVITDAIPDYTYFVSAGSSPDWSCTTNDFNNTCTYTLGTLTPPFTGSLTLVVAVNATIPETVDELLNVIDIAGQGNNGTEPMENNHDEDADELVSVPELVIEKSVDGVLFAPGETVTYTINYRNEGTQNATNVVIAETIPEYTTFNAAASDPRWVCSATSCTITLPLLSAPGLGENTGSALFVLVLDSPMQAGVSQIDNVVTIADDGANGPEINTENNTDNATITVGAAPDLTITKDDGVVQVTPGEDLTYSIVVSNVGNQHATGVIVTDTLPVGVTFVSTNLGGTYTEADREIIWNLGEMEAGASVTLIVEISVDEPFTGLNPEIVNEVIVADDGTNGVDPTPENNEASDRDLISSIGKVISATNQAHTGVLNVAVGEIVTYQVTLDVAPGTTQDLILQDVLEQGLAFVGCNAITTDPDAALTLEPGLTLNGLCTMAAITASPTGSLDPLNFGRQMLINFGDITNNTTDDIVLTVEYDVVVLNSSNNLSGEQRTNQAEWTWTGGSLELTATDLTLVEPELAITKTVTPTEAFSGTIVTYTITISHTEESETDAFNTLITDLIPAALTYVPDSLEFVSGQLPTTLNDLNAPALRIGWDIFSLSDDPTVLTYQVQVTNAGPGDEVVNAATLSWTSLPGIINNQTANNPFSDERTFEPGSTVDIYGIRAEASITIPSLPATGFAPGVITSLPQQPKDSAYSAQGDLRLTIPKQNIDLPIVGVPLGKTGWDLTWLNKQIGYLEGTAYPTWDGNTGLTAHVYNADGTPGPFVNLHLLRYGDQVKIYAFGQIYTYEVRSVSKVAPNDLSSLSHTDRSTMTLITCQGYDVSKNTYNWRVVVKTVLVSITPAK